MKVTELVAQFSQPIIEAAGCSLWDVEYVREGAERYLRLYIDKDGGVSIDDCVDLTHAINKPLDEADPIEQSYCLEVSSPGVERELVRDAHFEACKGEKIKVKLIRAVDGQRDFNGILEDFDGHAITLRLEDGGAMVFDKKETSKIRLDDFSF